MGITYFIYTVCYMRVRKIFTEESVRISVSITPYSAFFVKDRKGAIAKV